MTAVKVQFWTLFLLAHWPTLIHAVLIEIECTPTKVAVNASVGDTLQICCRTTLNKSVEWRSWNRNDSHSPPSRRIFDNYRMQEVFNKTGHFQVSRDKNGFFNLTIINVSVSDSVRYECTEDNGVGEFVRIVMLNITGSSSMRSASQATEYIKSALSTPVLEKSHEKTSQQPNDKITDPSPSSDFLYTTVMVVGYLVAFLCVVGLLTGQLVRFLKSRSCGRTIRRLCGGLRSDERGLLNQKQASTQSENEVRPWYTLNVNLVEELVSGLVYFDGTVFFCNFNKTDVWKINLSERSSTKESLISLAGAISLRSMAFYSKSSQILVADHDGRCIWKLSLSPTTEEQQPFIELKREPMAITLNSDRLLVTSKHNITLIDMNSRTVLMDQDFDDFIIYSVECPRVTDRFYVCEERTAVYHFDYTNGERTNKVEIQGGFNKPRCLIIDKNGNIIVADHFNHRLVVLGCDMRVRKEIKFTQAEFVNRLYYDQGENLLLVGFQSHGIKLYDVKNW